MVQELRERLEQKGWDDEYIEKTVGIIEDADKKTGYITSKINKIIYWIAILIAISGNFAISIILIPFLVTITNNIALGIIIFSLSLSFGFLFNVLLKDIEELDPENRIIAGLFIPSLGMINIFVITNVANHFINLFNMKNTHNPLIIGALYITAFITPYLYDRFFKNKQQKTRIINEQDSQDMIENEQQQELQ